MNKSKIEWCDYTWNPVTGCLHGCGYCYARRIANRFKGWSDWEGEHHVDTILKTNEPIRELDKPLYYAPKEKLGKWPKAPFPYGFIPTFHRYRLDEPQKIKKPSKIFVVSMGDLFGDWVPDEWINEVFEACKKAPQHTYLFLTKNPNRYWFFIDKCPKNFWLGASAVNQPDEKVIFNNDGSFLCTTAHLVADTMGFMPNSFLSIEPLLSDVTEDADFSFVRWVIVGAQTGPGAKSPKPEWVQNIIDQCRAAGVPVFLKNNLHWPEKIQEYPEDMI